MHQELRRPGVTLELLHVEYLAAHPTGYRYSAFCERYRAWRARQRLSMRQVHTAGEKAFVDYAGHAADDRRRRDRRGDRRRALRRRARRLELHLRRGDPHAAERGLDREPRPRRRVLWRRAGGVGAGSTADRRHACRAATSRACSGPTPSGRSTITRSIIPARPAKPRDKAKVEVAVQVAERWILARLRHETFFTLAALNARIARAAHGAQYPPDERLRRARRAAISSSASIGPRCSRCRPSASSTPTGSTRASTSTTTSRSIATTTRSRIR